ncbi:MAG: hypothetical protein Q9190_000842 [Brigantiaea leucoxantha]
MLFRITIFASLLSSALSLGRLVRRNYASTYSQTISELEGYGIESWGYSSLGDKSTHCNRIPSTSVITVSVTVDSTTTIPTSSGFTPIASETVGLPLTLEISSQPGLIFDPTRGLITVPTDQPTAAAHVERNQPRADIDRWYAQEAKTSPYSAYACPILPTVTRTTTATVASHTSWAACQPDNVIANNSAVREFTFNYLNITGIANPSHSLSRTDTGLITDTATDCCIACQRTPACAYSIFTPIQFDPNNCFLYFQENNHCNGSEWLGSAVGVSFTGQDLSFDYIPSNGNCGQIAYVGII